MAEFECKVYELTIEPHPNADAIELAKVGDYYSIVKKGEFKTGDLGVYIPEAAICPDWVISRIGLEGKLAGKKKNRVKAIKLRGVLSQGLIYPLDHGFFYTHILSRDGSGDGLLCLEGDDVTSELEIVKWEPPIPTCMAGEVEAQFGKTMSYDIENLKKYPNVIKDGDAVVITEKIHGTWVCYGTHPQINHPIVTSKGISAKGLIFKMNDANKNNLYIRALIRTANKQGSHLLDRLKNLIYKGTSIIENLDENTPVYLLGEVFGPVQDLTYGYSTPQVRLFDVYVGPPGRGYYLNPLQLSMICDELKIDMVPILYTGPFSKSIVEHHTNGKEVVSGTQANIREGVVIAPAVEKYDTELGRVKLKSKSEAYLLREGNSTEYN